MKLFLALELSSKEVCIIILIRNPVKQINLTEKISRCDVTKNDTKSQMIKGHRILDITGDVLYCFYGLSRQLGIWSCFRHAESLSSPCPPSSPSHSPAEAGPGSRGASSPATLRYYGCSRKLSEQSMEIT